MRRKTKVMTIKEKFKELTPFERFQLEQYGNLLEADNNDDFEEEEKRMSIDEQNYFFNLENDQL